MKYTIKLGSCIDGTVPLGWQNENKVKEVYFDASKWVAEYGAGILTLAIQRNGDAQPYPKALTDDTWTIEAVDAEKKGIGEFQVTFTVGEQVKESAVYKFFVERSLDSTGEMPDPYISYFEQIIEVGAQAEADADRAEEAADSIKNLTAEAETLPAGSSASASYDAETGVMTFGIPQGEQGERGADGVTPDIDIGTVETLETGVPAYANITGTVENPSLNLGLPKGNTGDTGATGAPAGFGAVTATIDGTTGTPSVDVTASGADTAKNFAFAFHNLKGEQGEQGEQGDPGVVQDVTVNGTSVVDQNGVAVITMPELVKTVQGNPIVLDDAFGEVKKLDVELLPIQDLHGYDKPWAAGAGANKIPIPVWFEEGYTRTVNGVTFEVLKDGVIKVSGTNTLTQYTDFNLSYANLHLNTFYIDAGKWTVSATGVSPSVSVITSGGGNNGFPYSSLSTPPTAVNSGTVTDSTKPFNYFIIRVAAQATVDTKIYIQLEKGSAATSWTPYSNICPITGHDSVTVTDTDGGSQSQSKTVTLPHAVYGAGVGVTSGESKDKTGRMTLNGSESWVATSSGRLYMQLNAMEQLTNYTGALYCDKLQTVTNYTTLTNTEGISGYTKDSSYPNQNWLYVAIDGVSTVAELRAWLADNPLEVVYPLATPTDLSTTPTDLTLYSGDNVISSDGDMELSYVQDMAIVIRKIEAQL